jgi:hypothetical protein
MRSELANPIDFSCGFQLNLSAGIRERHSRVVFASCSISPIKAALMFRDVAALLVLISFLLRVEIKLESDNSANVALVQQ